LRVKLAKTAGFCKGVKRAMNIVLDTANKKKKDIYTYGPLIHNPQAVELLESKNVKIINDVSEFSSGTIIIRTHGISPDVRKNIKETGADICDATCPDVMKVQSLIKRHAEKGYSIIIIGDKGHPEVIAHLGFSSNKGVVIDTEEEVENLPDTEKVCVVAQTTYDYKKFEELAERIKERFDNAEIYNTVCDATFKRQEEILKMCKEVDCMVIVGGRNSGNTKRLVQIAESTKTPVFHVETEEELDEEKLKVFNLVGVGAGASTPHWLIQKVINRIESISKGQRGKVSLLLALLRFLVKVNIYVALGAGFLTYAASLLQGIRPMWETIVITVLYIFSMHVLNRFTDKTAGRFNDPERMMFYEKHSRKLMVSAVASALTGLVIALSLGPVAFFVLLLSCIFGVMYSMRIAPKGLDRFIKYKRLKDIPASKDLFIAMAWSIVAVILPFIVSGKGISAATLVTFFFTFSVLFIRATIFDLRDMQGDRIVGRETFPIIVGENRALNIMKGLAVITGLVLIVSMFFYSISPVGWFFVLSITYIFFALTLFKKGLFVQRFTWEAVIDGNFLLLGMMSLVWNFLAL
jgi:(E)-4-hydroxy-3-methyl-but-2-enyl pyrophosphate reductase